MKDGQKKRRNLKSRNDIKAKRNICTRNIHGVAGNARGVGGVERNNSRDARAENEESEFGKVKEKEQVEAAYYLKGALQSPCFVMLYFL